MDINLKGRVAVVTGGRQGIGHGITQAFLEAGASVVTCARDGAGLEAEVATWRATHGERIAGIAADRLDDKASGFELGADDYLTKPFDLRELLARGTPPDVILLVIAGEWFAMWQSPTWNGQDSAARFLVLIGLAATGTVGWWGWLGVVPLLTAATGNCPLYSVLGFSSCPAASRRRRGCRRHPS